MHICHEVNHGFYRVKLMCARIGAFLGISSIEGTAFLILPVPPIESNFEIIRNRGNISSKSLCSKGLGCAYKTCTHLHFLHTLRHNVTLGYARHAFVPMIVKHR